MDEAQANNGNGTGSSGTGSGTATYNHATMQLTVTGSFTGMTGNSTACHVHQAPAGSGGGVVFGLTLTPSGATNGNFDGSGTLSAAQETALLADGTYVNVHSSAFGGGEIRGQILLQTTTPVEMVYFKAEPENKEVILSWATASEINNDYFEVQFSKNGRDFESVGEVNGFGDKFDLTKYQFRHNATGEGIVFYRLKQIDFDLNYEYSKIITADVSNSKTLIFPNPANNHLSISGNSQPIKIMDLNQKVVKEIQNNENEIINISELKPGIFYLILNTGETVRFVKN